MQKHLLRSIALSFLWLSVGLACKKEEVGPRTCDDGTCCGVDKIRFIYGKEISNEPVDLVANSDGYIVQLVFKNELKEPNWLWSVKSSGICDHTTGKVRGSKPSAELNGPFAYKYRVSGYLYGPEVHTISPQSAPVFLYITRIE